MLNVPMAFPRELLSTTDKNEARDNCPLQNQAREHRIAFAMEAVITTIKYFKSSRTRVIDGLPLISHRRRLAAPRYSTVDRAEVKSRRTDGGEDGVCSLSTRTIVRNAIAVYRARTP